MLFRKKRGKKRSVFGRSAQKEGKKGENKRNFNIPKNAFKDSSRYLCIYISIYPLMITKSIHSSTPHFEKQKVARFRRLDTAHISAIESLYQSFPFLSQRIEIHMPFARAKQTFSSGTVWVWPKFDKRPIGYLIFIDGFAPCIWYPDRQEGLTFRWLLPPTFCQKGATVCLANILAGESILQIEDIVIYEGKNLWNTLPFSKRWNELDAFWKSIPPDQPLLAFTTRIVRPISLDAWELHYDPAIYWIIQPDHSGQPRWYWKDIVTVPVKQQVFHTPVLKRSPDMVHLLCARCVPYEKLGLPDTYSLLSQEGTSLGIASISHKDISIQLTKSDMAEGIPVEVKWNESFRKYQILRIMPINTPITTASFFHHIL
jgi:hypothetical protein